MRRIKASFRFVEAGWLTEGEEAAQGTLQGGSAVEIRGDRKIVDMAACIGVTKPSAP